MSKILNFLENCNHLGRVVIYSLEAHPENICQIDASTGEKETNSSVLSRSIQLAKCLRNFGLRPGDVLSFSGRYHLDINIPHYAALMNGLPVVAIDLTYRYDEIKALLNITWPRIAFCQQEVYQDYVQAASDLGLDLRVVTYDDGEHSLKNFIVEFGEETSQDDFKVASIDKNTAYAWLVCTSGATAAPKVAAMTHHTVVRRITEIVTRRYRNNNEEFALTLNISPVQWFTAYLNAVLQPLFNDIQLQTSAPLTPDHYIDIVNQYRPHVVTINPSFQLRVLNHDKPCDYSCFDIIFVTGCRVSNELLIELKERVRKDALVVRVHGMTECLGAVVAPEVVAPISSSGRPLTNCLVKIVNTDTGEEIFRAGEHGELWYKGLRFTEYYRNPEETRKAITEDGWFKTGDLFYKDENNFYYFVDRLKLLIKFRNYHVYPGELEDILRTHPSVLDVCVTSVPHARDGEHPLACVVRQPGCEVSPCQIKLHIATKLSDSKQLRGGVVFFDRLPYTSTGKLARAKLKALIEAALGERIKEDIEKSSCTTYSCNLPE